MRQTELWFGVVAGIAGLLLAVLSITGILPYIGDAVRAYDVVCIAANATGIVGAIIVQRYNIAGSVIMAAVMIVVMCFGFPWQSIPAVMYIISVVLAVAPVRVHTKEEQGRTQL